MEITQDVKMTNNINFKQKVAFPLAMKSQDKLILIQEDFQKANQQTILQKLGITSQKLFVPTSVREDFEKVVARYIGLHAQVPCKTEREALIHGMTGIESASKTMESVIKSQLENLSVDDSCFANVNMKKTIASDKFMNKIQDALSDAQYRKKFEKDHPRIPLDSLKLEKANSKHLLTTKSGTGEHPIFGESVEKVIVDVDQLVSHQGCEDVMKYLKEMNITCFDEEGEEKNLGKIVSDHVVNCDDCKFVKDLKLHNENEGKWTIVKESDIEKVLIFADRAHQGFQNAHNRLKSWCEFPHLKEKVRILFS